MNKLEALKTQYQKALKRLDEILQKEKDDIVRDSAIKRFEFTFDLSWKLIKVFLEEKKGIVCKSPKECIREAYRQGLIDYDEFWLQMTDWRNEIVHNYGEAFADSLFEKIPRALEHFLLLAKKVSSPVQ
jgi:nucleotidyltransferase substrate binding protein (TIGR01987 family)